MLDVFLKTAYAHEASRQQERSVIELMKQLPTEELYKIASGEIKMSHEQGLEWLEKFRGSPLFEQAVQLEQESIQLEVADQQQRAMGQQMWSARDQICLKKRLLELQLAQQEAGAAPGAGAMQPPPPSPQPAPQGGEASSGGPSAEGGPSPKTVSVKLSAVDESKNPQAYRNRASLMDESEQPEKTAAFKQADSWGRELARADFQKKAHADGLVQTGIESGQAVAKLAFDMGSLTGLGQKAMGMAKANPSLAGAAIGGALGAASGLQKDEHGNRSLLKGLAGGAMGAAAGHAVGGVGGKMLQGQSLGGAAKSYGQEMAGHLAGRSGAPGAVSDSALGNKSFTSSKPLPSAPAPSAPPSPRKALGGAVDMTPNPAMQQALQAPNVNAPSSLPPQGMMDRAQQKFQSIMPQRPMSQIPFSGSVFNPA